jgi:hypothetical protein
VLYQLGCGCQQLIGFAAKLFGVGFIRHASIMPQTGMLKRRCEYSNLTHYPNCGWNCLRWSTSGKLFNERPMTLSGA